MIKNMSTIDRGTRAIMAFIAALLIVTGVVTGLAAVILGIVGVVLLVTSYLSFCPAYMLLKISSLGKSETK